MAPAKPALRNVTGPTVGFTALYYPGTPLAQDATLITVAPGEERSGVDMQLRLIPTARVEGMVSTPAGVPPQNVRLVMTPGTQSAPAPMSSLTLSNVSADADGKFRFSGVAPGAYTISARASSAVEPGGQPTGPRGRGPGMPDQNLWAVAEVTVNGENLDGVSLVLQSGMTNHGQGRLRGHARGARRRLEPRLRHAHARRWGPRDDDERGPRSRFSGRNGQVHAHRSDARQIPRDGGLQQSRGELHRESATFKGRDVLDFPFEVLPNEEIANAVVTFTDQTQSVNGHLSDATGRPAPDYTIVLFPSDKTLWSSSRRIRTTRPGTDGKYVIDDLPAGSYRIAALADIAPRRRQRSRVSRTTPRRVDRGRREGRGDQDAGLRIAK